MKMLTLMIALIVVIQLSACNTLRGVGKDVEKSGEAIQKSTNQLVRNLLSLILTLTLIYICGCYNNTQRIYTATVVI